MSPANLYTLPGPEDITRVELSNGIVVMARPNFNSPSVTISGYLACGSVFDPPEKLGLAHFTALGLMRGCAQISFREIYEQLESAGASLGFGASVHNTSFGGRALTEDLPLLLRILSGVLRAPSFPADQIERLRAQLLTGLAIREQDTGERAELGFEALLFPNHPYGVPEDGNPDTVQRIQLQDLVDYHRRYFGPRGMVITVVGGISPEKAVEEVSRWLGDWTNPEQPDAPEIAPVNTIAQTQRQHIGIAGKFQTDLLMGTHGPQRNAPDYLAASLGNSILGQFGMMGRIGDVVREQAGLAYYASTSLNSWKLAGSWEVSAGVNPANLQRAIDLIIQELRRFTTEPVTAEELGDSQANYIGRLPLSLESNSGVASALLNLERFQLGLDYYRRYPALVESITVEQVLAAAHQYIDPDRLVIVSAGPE